MTVEESRATFLTRTPNSTEEIPDQRLATRKGLILMRILLFCLVAIGSVFSTGHLASGEPQTKDTPVSEGSSREADRAAILQSGRNFTAAFEKGDAKAVAALWTEQGEYESDDATEPRGRAAIEAAFTRNSRTGRLERWRSRSEHPLPIARHRDRGGANRTTASDMLPDSSHYRTLHVREDGKWRIALSREWVPPRTA